ncbi:MAG: DUF4189 domain-containing protein [Alphaproteobacteria bacterium]|nr:DUF4189 domain-containing protein [Alphaproteobacteria bacterium]
MSAIVQARLPVAAALVILSSFAEPSAAQNVAQFDQAGAIAANAIAVARGGQRWGVGHAVGGERWNTTLRAAQAAMAECGRYDCRVQFQSVNPQDRCATIARGTLSYGLGIGPTAEAARAQALQSCAMSTTNCRVVDSRCP